MKFHEFKRKGENFVKELVEDLEKRGLPARGWPSDHLCYRVATKDEYACLKEELSKHGELLTEAMVNGRPISTFRLAHPFQFDDKTVPLLELPAPKDGVVYPSGFEHAEFVIDKSFSQFAQQFPNAGFEPVVDKVINSELCLRFDGKQAKFHHLSLERVIEIEESKITDIIFDFDGTLIQSREHIYKINRIVFSEVLGREVSLEESHRNFHPEFSKLFQSFGLICPVKQRQAISRWGIVSGEFSYRLFDGILELLDSLHYLGFRLHLWTARDEYSARKIMQVHGLEKFFVSFSFATEEDSKPHPKSLKFDWVSAGKNKVIMIGDTSSDIKGAQNIGAIRGVALWDQNVKKDCLMEAGGELFFNQVSDFGNYMKLSASKK